MTGKIQPANSGRSFRVYALINEEFVFIGLVSKKALFALLRKEIPQADVCKFDQTRKDPFNINLELGI